MTGHGFPSVALVSHPPGGCLLGPHVNRVVLLGASGQVGSAILRRLETAETLDRSQMDLSVITIDSAYRLISALESSVIINCAAYTAVDRAEDEQDIAGQVNGAAVGILAAVAADLNIPFVTYSTDYVFNGRGNRPYLESSPTDPVNAYGRSKLLGERLALEANPKALVIRTSWVISGTHPNFVATMVRLASEGRPLQVVDDQHGCPTVAGDLAEATLEAIRLGVTGVLHLTNQGATTWFDLARSAVQLAGLSPNLISPCSTDQYPTRAQRPAYSVLGSERVDELGLSLLPYWRDSLPDVVRQLSNA